MNKYEILGTIGEGAYATVYRAINKETEQVGKRGFLSFSGDKAAEGDGRRRNSKENGLARGQDAQNAQQQVHRPSYRGFQKVRLQLILERADSISYSSSLRRTYSKF